MIKKVARPNQNICFLYVYLQVSQLLFFFVEFSQIFPGDLTLHLSFSIYIQIGFMFVTFSQTGYTGTLHISPKITKMSVLDGIQRHLIEVSQKIERQKVLSIFKDWSILGCCHMSTFHISLHIVCKSCNVHAGQ